MVPSASAAGSRMISLGYNISVRAVVHSVSGQPNPCPIVRVYSDTIIADVESFGGGLSITPWDWILIFIGIIARGMAMMWGLSG
jgi:hypothetical protein